MAIADQNLEHTTQLSLDALQPEAALELFKSLIGTERIQKENDQTPQSPEGSNDQIPQSPEGSEESSSPPVQTQESGERPRGEIVALQLCERLGYLPLGLELIGRYLTQKPDLSLTEMLERFDKQRQEQHPPAETAAVQQGVLTAFELIWQELSDADKQLGCVLSLFAVAPIPQKLVEQCLSGEDPQKIEAVKDDILISLCLLQRSDAGFYQQHPLLREFFQRQIAELAQAEELKRTFCRVVITVAKDICDSLTLTQIDSIASAIPHLTEATNNFLQYINDEDLILPFIGIAKFYQIQGLSDQATLWYEQCPEVMKKRLGEEHPHVATSLNHLALFYNSQGKYKEAEPLYQQALALRRRLLGEEHVDVATSLNHLALFYNSQGKYKEAEPLYQQALALRRRLLGEEHVDVATSLNNLALFYNSQGKHKEAEPLYQQALALRRRLLGEQHIDVATSLNNLGYLYEFQGRYKEAEPLYQQALQLRQRLLENEHPDVITSLSNLGYLYESLERYKEAESLYLQAWEICDRHLGADHPQTITCRDNLAILRDRLS
ncbi:MAG: tetratricopeptide repeat protein [Desmonostoc vinosum HA7617-LM4]|jgi:tetratricopeptide (TPR) repeat protein|nr:tetratricopeptide repeat protein [Desmonostoc vinosum HA7617-LM4]